MSHGGQLIHRLKIMRRGGTSVDKSGHPSGAFAEVMTVPGRIFVKRAQEEVNGVLAVVTKEVAHVAMGANVVATDRIVNLDDSNATYEVSVPRNPGGGRTHHMELDLMKAD